MDRPWLSLEELADLCGITLASLRNAIYEGRCPIPTYKLGKRVVADKEVVDLFFAKRRAEGIEQLTRSADTGNFPTPKGGRSRSSKRSAGN
jgi:hypothetical protein